MKGKKSFLILVFLYFDFVFLFSQNSSALSRAILKTPFPIKSICWNEGDALFAYSEDNIVYVRDSKKYEIVDTFPIKNIKDIGFAKEGSRDVLLTLYDRGLFSIWNFKEKQPVLTESYNNNMSVVNAVAFSRDSNYIATAGDNNSINLYFKLRALRQTISRRLNGHKTPIYSLAFSNKSSYLASVSEDGRIIIWNCNTNAAVSVIEGVYTRSKVPVSFSYDDSTLFCCDSASSFAVYDLDGYKIKSVKVGMPIKKIQSLNGINVVAVLTEDNKIKLFDLRSNKYIGYIPSYNVSTLTDFMFNSDNSYVLVGFDDGSIYKINFEEALLDPNEEPPEYKLIQNDEIVVRGYSHDDQIFTKGKEVVKIKYVEKEPEPEPKKKVVDPAKKKNDSEDQKKLVQKDGRNAIFVYGGLDILSSPFLMGPALGGEYRFRKLLAPFYFGGGLEATVGFLNLNTYTFRYEINGVAQKTPFLAGANVYVPFGVIFPLGNGSMELSADFKVGARVMAVTLLSNGNYMIGEPNFTFVASAGAGFAFLNFEIVAGCKFDLIGKFTPYAELGYNIRVGK